MEFIDLRIVVEVMGFLITLVIYWNKIEKRISTLEADLKHMDEELSRQRESAVAHFDKLYEKIDVLTKFILEK